MKKMALSTQEMMKYDWVQFYVKRSNLKDKKTGARVGRYLAVAGWNDRWVIYNVFGGLPVMDDVIFNSIDDGVKVAKYIGGAYGEYLAIWEVWTDCDLLGIARLSVDQGEAIYETLDKLRYLGRNATYNDFTKILMSKLKCQTCLISS